MKITLLITMLLSTQCYLLHGGLAYDYEVPRGRIHGSGIWASAYVTLPQGMWGTPGFEMPKYGRKENQLTPLTLDDVDTPFFQSLKDECQQEKNRLLKLVMSTSDYYDDYLKYRKNMTALLLYDADLIAVQKELEETNEDLFDRVTHEQDHFMIEFLLKHGAHIPKK